MIGRDAVMAALKGMSKPVDWESPEAIGAFSDSLWNENDRGVIILNGSTMELLLEREIKRRMTHLNGEELTYLFGFNGPVGTFSSKIRMANALGLISRQIYRKMDLVREMRNACAHSREPISFLSKPILAAVLCLVHDLRFTPPNGDDNDSVRKTFMVACILLMIAVLSGSIVTAHEMLREILGQGKATSPTALGK